MTRRSRRERREVPRAPRAVAEVPPDEQPRRAESVHQHILHEALRREGRESRVEARHVHAIDARGREALDLLAQARQTRGRVVGREEFARLRLEGEHAGQDAEFARLGDQPREHRLVTAVHAIEIADRESLTPPRHGRAMRDDHRMRLKA